MTFAHLEVHSHFTLLGGTAGVAELAQRTAADGMSHIALADTNALYGAVAFSRACREAGVQPIIGMTVTVAGPTPLSPLPAKEVGGEPEPAMPGHLVLLARDPAGYRSLCRLSSLIQGTPDREAAAVRGLSWEDVQENRAGLICLSGGRRGWIERYLRAGNPSAAQVYAGRLAGIFEEHAYLALELHAAGDSSIASEIIALGRRLGIPAVAVQPIYCLSAADMSRLRLLAAIRENRPLGSEMPEEREEEEAQAEPDERAPFPGSRASPRKALPSSALEVWSSSVQGATGNLEGPFHTEGASVTLSGSTSQSTQRRDASEGSRIGKRDASAQTTGLSMTAQVARPDNEPHPNLKLAEADEVHWLTPAEVAGRFARFPDALAEAGRIAARCGEVLPSGKPIWPALKLPDHFSPDEALARSASDGLREKYANATTNLQPTTPRARLEQELAAIASHGYAPLFLVVADAVRFARSQGIPVSTRGSVANSLVACCIGITTVDPIEHGLLFERFLNPARANPPDIDLDFCSRRRDEVLRYLRDTYGPEHVALVGTISTMRLQSAVRETAKAYGIRDDEIGPVVGMLPHHWHPDPRRRDPRTIDDVLGEIEDPRLREVVRVGYTLVGQPDHLSVHPGGVVITPGPLTDVVPVQWAPKGFVITQFEHGDVEAVGLPKMDFLGIRALTVLSDTAEMVRRIEPGFRIEDIPLDDARTGDLLMRADTIGVFQCESSGAQRTLRRLRAHSVRDLAIANAFFKPGPAMGGMADAFVRRYRGEEPVTYLHPALEPILRETKGVLIFQEQVLRVAREVAALTWAQADQLRRGMGHFGADEMAALREQFVDGCRRPAPGGPGFSPGQADTLWEQVMSFAGYGFNQGHATAYADVSYRSAYLKAHWPAEFLCARLADYGGFHHPAIYMAEAIRLGIAVKPPHVNRSGATFTLAGTLLWMGLGQVRDLRRSAIVAIIAERGQRSFRGPRDLLGRVELQAKEAMHLVQCGALDGLGESRTDLLSQAEEWFRAARKGRGKSPPLQMALPFEESAPPLQRQGAPDDSPGPEASAGCVLSQGQPAEASIPEPSGVVSGTIRASISPQVLAQHLAWEMRVLGHPVSALADPLALVADHLPDHLPLRRLGEHPGWPVMAAGVRLPGWTGGPGFFLGDGETFVIAKGGKSLRTPQAWRPLLIRGRWVGDGWGSFWLQIDQMTELQADNAPLSRQGGI